MNSPLDYDDDIPLFTLKSNLDNTELTNNKYERSSEHEMTDDTSIELEQSLDALRNFSFGFKKSKSAANLGDSLTDYIMSPTTKPNYDYCSTDKDVLVKKKGFSLFNLFKKKKKAIKDSKDEVEAILSKEEKDKEYNLNIKKLHDEEFEKLRKIRESEKARQLKEYLPRQKVNNQSIPWTNSGVYMSSNKGSYTNMSNCSLDANNINRQRNHSNNPSLIEVNNLNQYRSSQALNYTQQNYNNNQYMMTPRNQSVMTNYDRRNSGNSRSNTPTRASNYSVQSVSGAVQGIPNYYPSPGKRNSQIGNQMQGYHKSPNEFKSPNPQQIPRIYRPTRSQCFPISVQQPPMLQQGHPNQYYVQQPQFQQYKSPQMQQQYYQQPSYYPSPQRSSQYLGNRVQYNPSYASQPNIRNQSQTSMNLYNNIPNQNKKLYYRNSSNGLLMNAKNRSGNIKTPPLTNNSSCVTSVESLSPNTSNYRFKNF